ncbi:MAG TPA: glycosyltransferase [Candidatus Bathyarchaeia archaeon]|nr:glycosyltransferase [Candidatus Bathyarchaeia archaeon]
MRKPGVLVVHNRYQQLGGEDTVVGTEVEVLRRNGHRVTEFVRDNSEIRGYNAVQRASLAVCTTWNHRAYHQLRELIRRERPMIAHCHNLVPLISPSAYYACRDEDVPVVQTLHNYRLRCPAGTMFRDGAACPGCCNSLALAVLRGCYRNSRVQTAAAAMMLATHRRLGTYYSLVDAYSTPSAFCAEQMAASGLPREKIVVRPNFLLRDAGARQASEDYVLFVGRICEEKGIRQLLGVFRRLGKIPLVVVGDGPMKAEAERAASANVLFAGALSAADTTARVKSARFLVFPSIGFETFGMTILEAAACGVATVGTRLGAIPELVQEGRTGLLFDPHDAEEFATKVCWAWEHPVSMNEMGAAARQMYLRRMTAEKGYSSLMRLYSSVSEDWDRSVTAGAVA